MAGFSSSSDNFLLSEFNFFNESYVKPPLLTAKDFFVWESENYVCKLEAYARSGFHEKIKKCILNSHPDSSLNNIKTILYRDWRWYSWELATRQLHLKSKLYRKDIISLADEVWKKEGFESKVEKDFADFQGYLKEVDDLFKKWKKAQKKFLTTINQSNRQHWLLTRKNDWLQRFNNYPVKLEIAKKIWEAKISENVKRHERKQQAPKSVAAASPIEPPAKVAGDNDSLVIKNLLSELVTQVEEQQKTPPKENIQEEKKEFVDCMSIAAIEARTLALLSQFKFSTTCDDIYEWRANYFVRQRNFRKADTNQENNPANAGTEQKPPPSEITKRPEIIPPLMKDDALNTKTTQNVHDKNKCAIIGYIFIGVALSGLIVLEVVFFSAMLLNLGIALTVVALASALIGAVTLAGHGICSCHQYTTQNQQAAISSTLTLR